MSREYQYKRYQLNLDPEDVKHMQIIDYLECHKAGKNRNEALVKVILAGFGEKVELDLPLNNPTHIKTEQRLKKMDSKLDKILGYLINQYGLKDIEHQDEIEEDKKAVDKSDISSYELQKSEKKTESVGIQTIIDSDISPMAEQGDKGIVDESETNSEFSDDISIPIEIMNFLQGL